MPEKKHRTPSRARYEQSHPVISVRVDENLYQRLKNLQELDGRSIGDILREALGIQEATAKAAFERGYRLGQAEATERFRVDYRCSICGGTMTIQSERAKRAAAEYMREHGWGHGACHKRGR